MPCLWRKSTRLTRHDGERQQVIDTCGKLDSSSGRFGMHSPCASRLTAVGAAEACREEASNRARNRGDHFSFRHSSAASKLMITAGCIGGHCREPCRTAPALHDGPASMSGEHHQRMKSEERRELRLVFSWMEKSATPLPFTSVLTMKPLEFSSHCSSPGLPVNFDTNVNF